MDEDASGWASLTLKGDIELGLPGGVAHLTGARIRMEGTGDATFHEVRLELEGPLGELRKLSTVGEPYRALLDVASVAADDAEGRLTLHAPPALVAELAAALPEGVLPDAWLSHPPWAALAFALDRYDPVGVSVRQAM